MSNIVLKTGSTGQFVKQLQAVLGAERDGKFGPATTAAVKAYQQAHGLTPDGIVGKHTMQGMGIAPALTADFSHYQGRIDWAKLRKEVDALTDDDLRLDGTILKATQDEGGHDPYFYDNAKGASDYGFPAAVYHFCVAENADGSDAVQEAQHLLEYVQPVAHLIKGPWVPDLESNAKKFSAAQLDHYAELFLSELEAHGKPTMLYTYKSFLQYSLAGGTTTLATRPLWIARYFNDLAAVDPGSTGCWAEWAMWQFQVKGELPGVPNKCDLNWCSSTAFEKLFKQGA